MKVVIVICFILTIILFWILSSLFPKIPIGILLFAIFPFFVAWHVIEDEKENKK